MISLFAGRASSLVTLELKHASQESYEKLAMNFRAPGAALSCTFQCIPNVFFFFFSLQQYVSRKLAYGK